MPKLHNVLQLRNSWSGQPCQNRLYRAVYIYIYIHILTYTFLSKNKYLMGNLKNSFLDYINIFEHCVYDKETVYLHFISDIRQRLCIH